MKWLSYSLITLSAFSTFTFAAEDPISWKIISPSVPKYSHIDQTYPITYKFTSELPFRMPSALYLTKEFSSDAYTHIDHCSGKKLAPKESCTLEIMFNPAAGGNYYHAVTMHYAGNMNQLPKASSTSTKNWVGTIGVDYEPNHYVNANPLNYHDVFYVGTVNSQPVTNVYVELAQLQNAGFTVARSYQTIEYSWIDIINQANALNMEIVYEASIPQNGSQTDINNALSVLNNVINAVGTTIFQNTVVLVLAGHENYSNSDINYLTSAISQLQTALSTQSLTIPVSSALVSGDLVTPGNPGDMQTLINAYSSTAPLGFDPYPFQWGATPPDQAVSNVSLTNSIAWDYEQVFAQSFYPAGRTLLMAETGWATQGVGTYAGYYCAQPSVNDCDPGIPQAAQYLTALYAFVNNSTNLSGALVFEAYDEPAKDPVNANNAENYYGVFDSDCNLKSNNLGLIPNQSFIPANSYACQGFSNGALLSVIGINLATQSPFTVQITQTNPSTSQSASMTVNVPNINRTNTNIDPWPEYLIFPSATVTITGSTPGNTCTFTVASVVNNTITWNSPTSCTPNTGYTVNCVANLCYLPTGY